MCHKPDIPQPRSVYMATDWSNGVPLNKTRTSKYP